MHILVAGGSGFLGRALTSALVGAGHNVTILTRGTGHEGARGQGQGTRGQGVGAAARSVSWTPDGSIGDWAASCAGVDAVVNLAGASIATRRWSATRKAELVESRLLSTRSLVRFIQHTNPRPSVFVSSSATGFYGDREDETLAESAAPGRGFLAELAEQWEAAARAAASQATRVVLVRTGIVLDPAEGALAKMLPAFRLFAGGPFGSGRQFMSWIHRDDWVALVAWCLSAPGLSGPVNAVAPGSVRNRAFATVLGRVLGRPAFAPVPAFVLTLALGEMAGPLLLASQRVVPAVAAQRGFEFRFPALEPALRDLLGVSK